MSTKPQDSASSQTGQQAGVSPSPSQTSRTMIFVVAAVGCLAVTGLFEAMNRPASIEEYGKMGQEFYPDFTDPTKATSLTVSVIDPDEIKPLEFSVKQASNGQWVIPSHHDYPADAADQLAKTASSIIGIKRGAMISRWNSDHTKYGVVDPVTDSVSVDQIDGIGKRVTIGGPDDTTLASYIVGKKYEDSNDQYYVRHPNEDETYIAQLDINLTTKFGDWVNTDLLDITSSDVLRLDLNDYSFDEIQGTITGNVQSVLSRATSGDDWQLEGINAETEQVNNTSITDTLNTLANLEIVGVRPKQPGLTADLQIDRQALKSQRDLDRLSSDLLSRGFILQPNRENQEILELISREGEMFVGAADGLLYRLYFGRAFTGSNEDLEFGMSSDDSNDEGETEADAASDPKTDESESNENSEDTQSGKAGRYVFVRVNFDPTLLGEVLTEPIEPQEPEEIKPLQEKIAAAAEEAAKEEGKPESDDASDNTEATTDDSESTTEGNTEDSTDAEGEAEETDEQKLLRLQEEFSAAQTEYQTQLAAYEEYTQKVEDGTKKAEDLNRRFALWYYVIPGESFDKLSLDRETVVEPKEVEASEDESALNAPPGLEGLSDAIMQNAGIDPSELGNLGNLVPPTPENTGEAAGSTPSEDAPKAESPESATENAPVEEQKPASEATETAAQPSNEANDSEPGSTRSTEQEATNPEESQTAEDNPSPAASE
ncbi:DUF4340 domain-containing protein [Rubripirellula sp.]|nr:DUF4340 domain-containing protein [Rubripirellula sp.]